MYENERRYDLVVRLRDESRKDVSDLQQLLVATPSGLQVPLYQVADVDVKIGPNQIQREDAKRRIIIGFNVRGRDVESVVNELEEKAAQQIKLSSGYFIKYGGQFENLLEAKKRLYIAVPAALLLILVMLYFAFGSLKQGLLIFSAIPLSAIGGILALWIRDMPFSISAGVGFIALFGVAVLNGIVLITEFNRLKKEGMQDIKQIIMEGTKIRLRPVLMTASVASLGFLPMALSHSSGAEVQRPLASVVIGGLITATFLTLIVLPVLYLWFEKIKNKKVQPIVALVAVLLLSTFTQAQQKMSLDEMIKQADENNLNLKAIKKETGYWNQLQSGVFDPPKTVMGGEYGSINSSNSDTRFFVNQAFSLPVVYRKQKEWYKTQELLQKQMGTWKTAELNRQVKEVFYLLTDAIERKNLLVRLDTVYSRFQQAATLRLQAGESNLLEKTTADAQLQQLQLQQEQLDADTHILQQRLQLLLNTTAWLLPEYQSVKIVDAIIADTISTELHPRVLYVKLQEETTAAQTRIEQSKLNPEFSVGYNNQSITGYQSPDGINQKYYDAGHRFHFVNLSVGIPLFNAAAKARIRAGKINEEVARINTMATEQDINTNRQQIIEVYKKQQHAISYYERAGLQQADLIVKNAKLSFENGQISYLEWTVLMNNAVSIQLNYIDAVKQFNQTAIELAYLNGK
jgi:heavy metal efflux system protein